MTEELEYKGQTVKAMPVCSLEIVDGHIEAECESTAASHELAELLQHEVVIRVKPKAPVLEEPPAAPVTES